MDVFTQVGFECEINGDLIEFDITPNRGDVLSLKGLEREFCAYQNKKPKNQFFQRQQKNQTPPTIFGKTNQENGSGHRSRTSK